MLEGVFGFQLRGQVPPLPATGLCPVFTADRELTPESFSLSSCLHRTKDLDFSPSKCKIQIQLKHPNVPFNSS